MTSDLKTRIILALRTGAGSARSSEAQTEALEVASLVEAEPVDDVPPVPPAANVPLADAFPDLRASVQASTAQAELDAYAKVNAPSEG